MFYALFGEAAYARYPTGYEITTLTEAEHEVPPENMEHKSRARTDPYGVVGKGWCGAGGVEKVKLEE